MAAKPPTHQTAVPAVNILLLISGALLFIALFTNFIPFVEAGWLNEFGSKSKHARSLRLFAIIFFAILVFARGFFRPSYEQAVLVRSAKDLITNHHRLILWVLFIIYAGSAAIIGLTRQAAFETRSFDLGIFAQALWTTLQGDFLYSSIKGGICLLGDHMSPILLAAVPFYAIWPDPRTILVLQGLAMAACIPLVYLIAQSKLNHRLLSFAFAFSFFLSLPSRNVLREDFHPEVLAQPLFFLAFYLLEKNRIKSFAACLFAILLAKENMAGIVFIFGVYLLVTKRSKPLAFGLMIFPVIYFTVVTRWLIPGISGDGYLYEGFYRKFQAAPLTAAGRLFSEDTLTYVVRAFSPLGFLSFFHWPTLILTFPILFQNLLSENEVFRSFGYHYTIGLTAFVFISAIYGTDILMKRFLWLGERKGLLAILLIFIAFLSSGPSEYYFYRNSKKNLSESKRVFAYELRKIPASASVLTHNNVIPQTINRKFIHQLDYNPEPSKTGQIQTLRPDYIAFASEFWEPNTQPLKEVLTKLPELGYEVIYNHDGHYLLKKKTA